MGVIDIKTSDRNGAVVGAVRVGQEDQIMLISDAGTLVRTAVAEVSSLGRNTQGVRFIRLTEGEKLVEITAIDESDAQTGDEAEFEESTAGDASAEATDAGTPTAESSGAADADSDSNESSDADSDSSDGEAGDSEEESGDAT